MQAQMNYKLQRTAQEKEKRSNFLEKFASIVFWVWSLGHFVWWYLSEYLPL